MSCSLKVTEPFEAGVKPIIVFNVVVFPAPFRPSNTLTSPSAMLQTKCLEEYDIARYACEHRQLSARFSSCKPS